MLSQETVVEYVMMEWRDNFAFRQFLRKIYAQLKAAIPDLEDPPICFATQVAPGIPLAKPLLEAYLGQERQPQWQRLRRTAQDYGLI